ncbi:thiamine phosphate synthase [Jiulongibacter sp. NS-SX5]|uniref:thiamine phosphate synthase n=1 Tax=Jiulongibacter sp. NS-SX5 TaxID=3463854 RepID=UPI0040598EA0
MSRKIYVVADPALGAENLIEKLKNINSKQVFAVQIWNNFQNKNERVPLLRAVSELCQQRNLPLFVNGNIDLIHEDCLDGFHLDEPLENIQELKELRPDLKLGLTCNNEPEALRWAEKLSCEYISFCSVFPSKTSNSCDLVTPESIINATKHFSGKVFLAGGINELTIKNLDGLPFDGVALVSAIMDATDPELAITHFYQLLNQENEN